MIQLLKNKKTWLQNSDNHLEDQLVGDQDAGAAKKKKKKFKYVQKKKTKFKKQCKKMVIGIFIKLQEHSPLNYSLIRNSSSLVPETTVHQSEESSLRFRSLADKLCSLDKITAQVVNNAKNQFDKLIQSS